MVVVIASACEEVSGELVDYFAVDHCYQHITFLDGRCEVVVLVIRIILLHQDIYQAQPSSFWHAV